MANIIYSANMNLPIPVVGSQSGPDYALNVDSCFQLIDAHDHTSGNGVQITPDAININADLPLNGNDLTSARSVRFTAQTSVPAVTPDLGCLYVVGDDLYYNDEAGNAIRITQSGAVAGAAGTITGLPSGTASASYSAGPAKFIFQSASNVGADLDFASAIIREKVANGKGVTLSAPAALAADYGLILPAALPASQKFATVDNSGNIAANWAVDNSTLEVSTNTVQVKNGGITKPKLAALGQQLSSSSGAYVGNAVSPTDVTNLTVTITTTGRPVFIGLIGDGSTSLSEIYADRSAEVAGVKVYIVQGSTIIANYRIQSDTTGSGGTTKIRVPPSSVSFIDVPSANTYTYKIQAEVTDAGSSPSYGFTNIKLIAYEL